jgi:3-deoxy-D-manno-octulosonate 8-phosphate phosphatase (KDO 8-P phosphatase)
VFARKFTEENLPPAAKRSANRAANKFTPAIRRRAARIRVLLMDVDGTLTDGHVLLLSQPDGSALEIKSFGAQDGLGLTLAATAGIRTGVITGRESAAMRRRAKEARIEFVYEACPVKIPVYEEILKITGATDEEVAYVGDDLPDLPVMRRVGLAVAVGNAVAEVRSAAHFVTSRDGGEGAVREVVELILKSQGKWESLINKARA